MQREAVIDEGILIKNENLDLSNATTIYVKNIGSTNCNFGLLPIAAGRDMPAINVSNANFKQGENKRITFTTGKGQLYYQIVRLLPCSCKCKLK